MMENATTHEDSTEEVHLPPNPPGKLNTQVRLRHPKTIELYVQNTFYAMEENTSLFTSDTTTPCNFNVIEDTLDLEINSKCKTNSKILLGIHSQSKHKYRNAFGNSNRQYHDFDNGDALTFKDKYSALLQQELQNPYWCLHDPIMTKSYQISTEMDIETMPHAMYFTGNT